jgi:hypothetical protein
LGGAEDLAGALAARAAIAAIPGEGGAEAALLEPILTTAASLPSPCIPGTASSLNGRFLIKSNSYKNTSASNRYVSKGFCFIAQNGQK